MADTSNLENFLQDVADAIKEKKEYPSSQKIAAEDFDTEISSITGGMDTSDATAETNDIISPKTAYVDGEKITGTIIPEYEINTHEYNHYPIFDADDLGIYNATEYNGVSSLISIEKIGGKIIRFYRFITKTGELLTSKSFNVDTYIAPDKTDRNYYTTSTGDLVHYGLSETETEVKYLIGITGESRGQYYRQGFVIMTYDKDNDTISFGASSYVQFGHKGTQPDTQRFAKDPKYPNTLYLYEQSWSSGSLGKITLSIDLENNTVTPTLSLDSSGYLSAVGTFAFTGDGDYLSTGNHIIYRDPETEELTKYSSAYTYFSYDLSYMWVGNKLYSTTPSSDFDTMNNNKTLIFTLGINGNFDAVFSKDNKFLIVDTGSSNRGLVIYEIDEEDVTEMSTVTSNNYVYRNQQLNDWKFYFFDKTELYMYMYISTDEETTLISLTRDDDKLLRLNPSYIPDKKTVLQGTNYYLPSGRLETGVMPNNGGLEYDPSDEEQTIPLGYTSGGKVNPADITVLNDYKTCNELANTVLAPYTPKDYFEVEYIESTGAQYIDTGILSNSNLSIEMEMAFIRYNNNTVPFGTTDGNGNRYYMFSYGGGGIYFYTATSGWNSFTPTVEELTTKHTYKTVANKLYFDDVLKITANATAFTTEMPIYLFGHNNNGTAASLTYMRLYSCKIYDENDILVRDFIPVVDTQYKPALYDKVSEQFFYNNASGNDFVAGPDVYDDLPGIEVEYIQGTGTQYIDTGYIASDDVKFEIEISDLVKPSSNSTLLTGNPTYGDNTYLLFLGSDNAVYWAYNSPSVAGNTKIAYTTGTVLKVACYRGSIWVNDEVWYEDNTAKGKGGANITVFRHDNRPNVYTQFKLHSLKIWDNNVLVRDFMPMKEFGGLACLYDKINEKCYYSDGSDEFIAGPEKEEVE